MKPRALHLETTLAQGQLLHDALSLHNRIRHGNLGAAAEELLLHGSSYLQNRRALLERAHEKLRQLSAHLSSPTIPPSLGLSSPLTRRTESLLTDLSTRSTGGGSETPAPATFQVTLSVPEAEDVVQATDLLARLHLGQLHIIHEVLFPELTDPSLDNYLLSELRSISTEVTGLPRSASFGIGSPHVAERAWRAFEICDQIYNTLHPNRNLGLPSSTLTSPTTQVTLVP